jgi:hypothetical protein
MLTTQLLITCAETCIVAPLARAGNSNNESKAVNFARMI